MAFGVVMMILLDVSMCYVCAYALYIYLYMYTPRCISIAVQGLMIPEMVAWTGDSRAFGCSGFRAGVAWGLVSCIPTLALSWKALVLEVFDEK